MTNAFSTRRQNKDKTEDLRRSIQHVLDEMADLRDKKAVHNVVEGVDQHG